VFSRPLIAIDIGSSAVKVVELTGNSPRALRRKGLHLLPGGSVVDGAIQKPDEMADIVKELLGGLKIRPSGRRAAISLSGSAVMVKRIKITRSKDQELSEQIYYEAEQHFQHDMSDLYFDFAPLTQGPDPEGTTPVLLVGAKREHVEQHIGLVHSLGMRAGLVDCDVLSVANMFEYNYGQVEGLVVLVNIGSMLTQVTLMVNGNYLYGRDVALGGEEYTKRLMETLAIDHANAESLKIAASQGEGAAPEGFQAVINDLNDQMVGELQSTLDYLLQSGEAPADLPPLRHVFMTGGGARTLGLDAAIAAAMQVPVNILNPFQKISVNPKFFDTESLLIDSHLFGTAMGLAIRSMGDQKGK
jgi:type IV pilus assembly protein PilM